MASRLLQELARSTDSDANAKFFAWPLPTIHLTGEEEWKDQRDIFRSLFSKV